MLNKERLSNVKVRTSWRDIVPKSPIIDIQAATYSRFRFDLTPEMLDIVEDMREKFYTLPIYGLLKACQHIPLPDLEKNASK